MAVPTHYDNLKVSPNAPTEVIHAAYKALAQKHHPDKNAGSADATRIMKIINQAHAVLSDPQRRAEYDLSLQQEEEISYSPPPPPSPPPSKQRSKPSRDNKAQKTYSTSGIILFLLSLLYLGMELVFNRQLLDVSSSVRSDPEQVERIQYFGRMASGLGFTLLVLGIFQQFGFRISNRRQWAVFSVITFICLMPFVMTFGQILLEAAAGNSAQDDVPYTTGMAWGFLPFIGLYFVLIGRGRRPCSTDRSLRSSAL